MASSIATNASFATFNMKPDPGDQADALWAQKIADNTGYLGLRPFPGPCFFADAYDNASGGNKQGTFYFRKESFLGTMRGTVVGTHKGAADDTINIWVDGTNVFTQHYTSTATQFKASFATAISHLTDWNFYELSWSWTSAANSGPTGMAVTTWQGA